MDTTKTLPWFAIRDPKILNHQIPLLRNMNKIHIKTVSWKSPELIYDKSQEPWIKRDILKPAKDAICENMVREEIKKLCNLRIQINPKIKDMGMRPLRFKPESFKQVFPFVTRITRKSITLN